MEMAQTTNILVVNPEKEVSLGEVTSLDKIEVELENPYEIERLSHNTDPLPDMWSKNYIGLYCQYAAVGLVYGTALSSQTLCFYVKDGNPNLCANASNIAFFAWSIKIFYAIGTDSFRPLGYRRVPFMITGWVGVLITLFVLAISADTINTSAWIGLLALIQIFAMLSDVPADGYSVELGQMEPPEMRGTILSTGQVVRFAWTMVAGGIQAFLLNSPQTNAKPCPIGFDGCWKGGLSMNGYYWLNFALVFMLALPIFWLHEPDGSKVPRHTLTHYFAEIWSCLKNLTTFYLIIYVVGINTFSNFVFTVNIYMQYSIIKLSNFQAGIDTMTSFLATSAAVYIFKTYLINVNWRFTNVGTTIISSIMGLLWILVYHNVGGLRDGWFTIFIDLDQSFISGISQVLFSLAVIELAKPGLEATTYELIISVANAANTASSIIATQFLTPLDSSACSQNDAPLTAYYTYSGCEYPSDCVAANPMCYDATDGPNRYTNYTIMLIFISIGTCLIFVNFLPKNRAQCHQWREQGEKQGDNSTRGLITLALCVVTVLYGIIAAILLMDSNTACLKVVGGPGC